MILLQATAFDGDNSSPFKWILSLILICLVVYRIFIYPRLNRTTPKKEASEDTVQRDRNSPLEDLLGNLVRGLDGELINSTRFKSPLLAAIFTKRFIWATFFTLSLTVFVFVIGDWQASLVMLGMGVLVLWEHSHQYIYVWEKKEGGKDILTGLYWYYKDSEKSLQYLMKANVVNSDPFIAYLIAEKLYKIESRKHEEERTYSLAIDWYEQVIEHSKYDIRESLNILSYLKIQEGEYEDALYHLATLKDAYGIEYPRRYLAAYLGLGEKDELKCDLEGSIEYYEQASKIDPELQPDISCIITSKLTFLYSKTEEFNNSKAKAEQLLKFYLAGEFQNKLSTSKPTFYEFIEEVSYPFKCTADIEGFVSMLSQGINNNTSEEMAVEFKSYLVKYLRRAGRIEQAEAFEQDLFRNHGKNLAVDSQRKNSQPDLLEISKSAWNWDQVIAICDERIPENQGNKPYYYLTLIKALIYKGKLDEAFLHLDSLIELQSQENSFYLPDEDFHLFARLYQADCKKGKAIKIYEMWMAKENKGSYVRKDKIKWMKKKIKELS